MIEDTHQLRLRTSPRRKGPEDLFAHNLHVRCGVRKDSGLDEVAFVANALAAGVEGGTLLLAGVDEGHDTVVLLLRDLRTLVDASAEGVANLERLRLRGELGQELVVDPLVDEDARARAARLAVVPAVARGARVNSLATRVPPVVNV